MSHDTTFYPFVTLSRRDSKIESMLSFWKLKLPNGHGASVISFSGDDEKTKVYEVVCWHYHDSDSVNGNICYYTGDIFRSCFSLNSSPLLCNKRISE